MTSKNFAQVYKANILQLNSSKKYVKKGREYTEILFAFVSEWYEWL